MQLLESLRDWLRDLRLQRARTLSTLMGIVWGTFGVVGILAFGDGLEEVMRERAQGMGRGVVVLWGRRTTLPFAGRPEGHPIQLDEADAAALARRVPTIESLSPEYVRSDNLRVGERVLSVTICGVTPEYGSLRNMAPTAGGRFLDDRDLAQARSVVFIGNRVADDLFGERDPVGSTVQVLGAPFTVVGVLEPRPQDSDYEGKDDERVCMPFSTYRRVFGERYLTYIVFAARDVRRNEEVTAEVRHVLAARHGFDPDDLDALGVWDTTEGDRIRDTAFLAMDVMVTLACLLTLLVGGIGVGNLMFLQVRRRTPEIGLRMALGARPRWILTEVLVQAVLLVAAGGAIGFAGAWLLGLAIGASPLTEVLGVPRITSEVALAVVLVLGAIGLVAGWFPARRAANLDPVRALLD